jgi:hypothetical protein
MSEREEYDGSMFNLFLNLSEYFSNKQTEIDILFQAESRPRNKKMKLY